MFTGLVERVGEVLAISGGSGPRILRILAPDIAPQLKNGESVAVSGACLTVTRADKTAFEVEMMEETTRTTRLGALKVGARVNLERALRLDSRLDGHLVAGHVDAVGSVSKIEMDGSSKKLWFSVGKEIMSLIAPKGSVAIDGVSLTVIESLAASFSVGLIPTTLRETTIAELRPGDDVNIEADLLARYIARLMSYRADAPAENGVTWETLRLNGWA